MRTRGLGGFVYFALLIALLAPAQAQKPEYYGQAKIIDGDTIVIGAVRIRFFGIDAPETRQTCLNARGKRYACGRRSTAHLRRLIRGRAVRCKDLGRSSNNRRRGRCFVGKTDLQAAMARAGHAVVFLQHGPDYRPQQAKARRARRGLWRGKFRRPEAVRRCRDTFQGSIASCS